MLENSSLLRRYDQTSVFTALSFLSSFGLFSCYFTKISNVSSLGLGIVAFVWGEGCDADQRRMGGYVSTAAATRSCRYCTLVTICLRRLPPREQHGFLERLTKIGVADGFAYLGRFVSWDLSGLLHGVGSGRAAMCDE
jgi:hypothetical protein